MSENTDRNGSGIDAEALYHAVRSELDRALAEFKRQQRIRDAAPDMLEALKEAREQVEILQARLGIKDSGHGTLSIIDAAISKATSHTPTSQEREPSA